VTTEESKSEAAKKRVRVTKSDKREDRATQLLDELLKGYKTPEEILGANGLLGELTRRVVERASHGELTTHLGYEKHEVAGRNSGNSRNGTTAKTIQTQHGNQEIRMPRDRNGTFEPILLPQRERRLGNFDDLIISLYGRGLTQAQISEHIQEIYGVELSVELISNITDAVAADVTAWRTRPLSAVYPIVYLDGLRVHVRINGRVDLRVIYVVIGVNLAGLKDVLGFWADSSEGAKFWLSVVNDLKNRGVRDILIACVDGLKGFPDAIKTVFPDTEVPLCIVHLIRSSTRQVAWTHKKEVVTDLKPIYTAVDAEAAELALKEFDTQWGQTYPMVAQSWRNVWVNVVPFFKFPDDLRKAIYTTNVIESINSSIRHITNNRALFPSDDAVYKLLYLALTNAARKWTMPIRNWKQALQQFAVFFPGRVPLD
jgi:putative transposase